VRLLAAGIPVAAVAVIAIVFILSTGDDGSTDGSGSPARGRSPEQAAAVEKKKKEEMSAARWARMKETYDERRLAAKTPEDHYQLALWCKRSRLDDEMRTEAEWLIAKEPDHEGAHRLLGHRYVTGDHPDYRDRWIASASEWENAIGKEREYQKKLASDPRFAAMQRAVDSVRYHLLKNVKHFAVRAWPYVIFIEDFGKKSQNDFYAWEKKAQVLAFYRYMKKTFPHLVKREPKIPYRIIVFKDRESFDRYHGGGASLDARAYYNLRTKFVYYYEREKGLSGQLPETILGVLFHECTHQLVDDMRPRDSVIQSVWFNEAFAEYIGAVRKTGRDAKGAVTFEIAKVNLHLLESIHDCLKDDYYFPLHTMFQLRDYEEADHVGFNLFGKRGLGQWLLYAQGWSFIYFCMHEPSGRYREKMLRYVTADVGGEGDHETLARCFGLKHPEKEWKEIEREWLAYIRRLDRDGNLSRTFKKKL